MFSIVYAGLIFTFMILTSSKGVDHVFGDSVISTISVEKFPQAIVFNPANNNIYVMNRDSGTVSIIEITNNTVIKNIDVGMSPQAIEFNPAERKYLCSKLRFRNSFGNWRIKSNVTGQYGGRYRTCCIGI